MRSDSFTLVQSGLRFYSILLLLSGLMWGVSAKAASPEASALIQQSPQVLNMGGYVMGAETNMNTQYARKFNYGLLQDAKHWDDGPVIIMETPILQQERFLLNMPGHWSKQTDNHFTDPK